MHTMNKMPVILCALCLGMAGCSGKSSQPGADSAQAPLAVVTSAGGVDSAAGAIQSYGTVELSPPEEFQEGVGLRAQADGNSITISILNERPDPLLVHPRDFGVIVDGTLHRVEMGKTDVHLFPPKRLAPHTLSGGIIRFPGLGDLSGQRLVFNNPEVGKPFFVEIQGAAPRK